MFECVDPSGYEPALDGERRAIRLMEEQRWEDGYYGAMRGTDGK